MANPEAPRSHGESTKSDQLITRRRVLAWPGFAGLAAVPSLLAACSTPAGTAKPSTALPGRRRAARPDQPPA